MSNEQTIKSNLLSKESRDLHHKFFQRDQTLNSIKVPILNDLDLENPVVPFRNTSCMRPICVYDLQGLLKRCQSVGYKSSFHFTCKSCNTNLDFTNFVFDAFLSEIVEAVHKMQDIPNKKVYVAVIIKRDDTWQPVLWEKPKSLTNTDSFLVQRRMYNDRKPLENNESTRLEIMQSALTQNNQTLAVSLLDSEFPPHLDDYDQEEYERLLQEFDLGSNIDYILYQKDNSRLTRGDLSKLEQGEIITNSMASMYADYLNILQRAYKKQYNKKNGNRHFVLSVHVLNYDRINKRPKYEFLSCINQYKDDPKELLARLDKLSFVVYYDERWIVAVLDLKDEELLLVDFLAEGLSHVRSKEIIEVIRYIIRAEFPHTNVKGFQLYNLVKLNFLSDCGLYVFSFIYKCMNNALKDGIDIQFWEKDLFRKKIAWLVLKIGNIKKNEASSPALKLSETTRSHEASSLQFSAVDSSSRISLRPRDSGGPALQRVSTVKSEYFGSESQVPKKITSVNTIPEENERPDSKASSIRILPQRIQLKSILAAEPLPVGRSEPMDFKGSSRSLNTLDNDSLGTLLKNPSEFNNRTQRSRLLQRNPSGTSIQSSNVSLLIPNEKLPTQRRMNINSRNATSLNNLDDDFQNQLSRKIEFNNIFTGVESQTIQSIVQPVRLEDSTKTIQIGSKVYNSTTPKNETILILPPINNLASPKNNPRHNQIFASNSSSRQFTSRSTLIKKRTGQPELETSINQDQEQDKSTSEVSQSIVLFGFQGKNQKPARININAEEERGNPFQRENKQNYSLQNSMDTIVIESKRNSQIMDTPPQINVASFRESKRLEESGIFNFDNDNNNSKELFIDFS